MSKSQTADQRWRGALQKVRQLVRLSRPYKKPETNDLPRVKTRFARKQREYVLSDKPLAVPTVCDADCENRRRADSQKSKSRQCRNMRRKYAPSHRLPPILEDRAVGFEETLKAEPQDTEHHKVKIHRAKPQQHREMRDGLRPEKRTSTFITPSVILESLVAMWINHGGSVVVIVLFGVLASNFVC